MTTSPGNGGPTGALRNSLVLDAACRTRGGTLRILAALLAALASGAILLLMWLRLDGTSPYELHLEVRHAAVLHPR